LKVSVNPRLVRGLDYYTDTVFEFVPRLDNVAHADPGGLGAQGTVLAGGSYGTLVASLGGKDGIVGTGWSAGLDRLALLVVRVAPPVAPVSAPS
jgi:histidyl-tRNA synthetase